MTTERDAVAREILEYDTIAIVGCSTSPGKAAHDVPSYLDKMGYRIVPVNPHADEVLGERAYESIAEVDEEIDVVNVFRPSDEVAGIVDEALERDDVEAIWLQLGITDDEAARRAREAGLEVVQDRCMKVEDSRLG